MVTDTTEILTRPWGHEEIWALTDRYCGKYLYVNKGESLSWQYHERKDETIRVLHGLVKLELSDTDTPAETALLQENEKRHIPAGKRHRMTAIDASVIVEVSTPELGDVVRIEDRYGRTTNR